MKREEEIHKESYHKYTWSPAYMLAFEAGAEWADKTMLDKVCKWLINALHKNNNSGTFNYVGGNDCSIADIVNVLKQAMEE